MTNDPEFIKCAMDAVEEGFKASEIKEECACRLGNPSQEQSLNQPFKE